MCNSYYHDEETKKEESTLSDPESVPLDIYVIYVGSFTVWTWSFFTFCLLVDVANSLAKLLLLIYIPSMHPVLEYNYMAINAARCFKMSAFSTITLGQLTECSD